MSRLLSKLERSLVFIVHGRVLSFDVESFELVSTDKTYPDELSTSQLVGASHGWGFFSNIQDRSLLISDFLNPYASKSKPTMIPLPSFTTMTTFQTEVVCNVAMSSSPEPYHEDWVVGIKFLGRQLSFCKPLDHLRWTNFPTPFESWDCSNLMFSKKDKRFYMVAPGGNCLCSWDLDFRKHNKPMFHELVLHDLPSSPHSDWKQLDSYCREDHWVESPSGECFLVKWFSEYSPYTSTEWCKLPMVMVFREEETKDGRKHLRYTQDIGDLCIFISKGEDFCVPASSFPGLYPNSIFLHGRLFATFDMTKRTIALFEYPQGTPQKIPYAPFWLPPFTSG